MTNLEEADSSDTNGTNATIANEGRTTITSEQRSFKGSDAPMLFLCDEGNTAIARKT